MLNGGDFADQKAKIERAVASGKQRSTSRARRRSRRGALDASEDDRIANAFAREHHGMIFTLSRLGANGSNGGADAGVKKRHFGPST